LLNCFEFVFFALYLFLSNDLVELFITGCGVTVITVLRAFGFVLFLDDGKLAIEIFKVDSVLHYFRSPSIGHEIKDLLDVKVSLSFSVDSYQSLLNGLLLDITVGFRPNQHSGDLFVPWIIDQILKELFFAHKVFCKLRGFLKGTFDDLNDFLADHIDIRAIVLASEN
jgi:hypothetical protein